MPKESLGFIRLIWTCSHCSTRNPGPFKYCQSCGAPQPADVKFDQPAEMEFIKDEQELARARAGSDFHCGFCGTPNPAGSAACSQCGADLKEGKPKESGEVVGAFHSGPAASVPCPACSAPNPADASHCKQCGAPLKAAPPAAPKPAGKTGCSPLMIGIGVGVLALVILIIVLLSRTKDLVGSVQSVNWTRTIAVVALRDVQREDWRDQIPGGAVVGTCREKLYAQQDSPSSSGRSEKVCGTPYTIDRGNGFAEVVQDCAYDVYADYCTYTVQDWVVINQIVDRGTDLGARWPDMRLSTGEREGERSESYQIVFEADGQTYTFDTTDYDLYSMAQVGSEWVLKVNSFGALVDIEPAQ